MNPHAHFAVLARYDAWATGRVLAVVAPLPDADYRRDLGLFFRSVHGTLNHLAVTAGRVWFRRFAEGASPKVALDEEIEPDRARLAALVAADAAAWAPLIASWPAERFDGELRYTTMRGNDVALPFAATLAHVFNHATHHRGQIHAALTRLGAAAPELDLVHMLQQERR